jgi:microsomal dipeptidase-like Zn-dependent dipeptidase
MTDKLRNIEIGKNTSLERGNLNSIDLHCDTLLRLHFAGENASLAKNEFHIDLQKLRAGGIDTQVFAVFVPPRVDSPLQLRVTCKTLRITVDPEKYLPCSHWRTAA